MISVYPLNATSYTAEALGAYNGTRTRGVFSSDDCFTVAPLGGRKISVSSGLAWLKLAKYWGVVFISTEPTQFELDVANGALSRYVAIVLQIDKVSNAANIICKNGELSSSPQMVKPIQTGEFFEELIVSQIIQRGGSVEITAADITDLRTNEAYCGIMRDGVTGIPTAQLQKQADALITQLNEAIKTSLSGALPDKSVTTAKFAPDALAPNGFITYSHVKTDNVHTLIGTGENGKFKATSSGEVSSFNIGGTNYPVKCGEESYIDLIENNWYLFMFDGVSVNFNQGGAALNFKVISSATRPQSPKENTIWINTSVAMPTKGYIFSNTQPVGKYAVGTVWIKTGLLERLSFNAVKKGEMILTITNAYQYDGTAFVIKKAEIYQNNAWQELFKWFYNRGINNLGSFVGNATVGLVAEVNRIRVYRTANSYDPYAYATTPIDMTPLKTIFFIGMTPAGQTRYGIIGLGTSAGNPVASLSFTTQGIEKLLSFDVTSQNGNGYMSFSTSGDPNTNAYFYEIYGEYL